MAIKDIFRPKWRHSNPKVRKAAIKKLTDQKLLLNVAINDNVNVVREVAVQKLKHQEVLADIAKNDTDIMVRCSAIKNINAPEELEDFVNKNEHDFIRLTAIKKINNQNLLYAIAKNDTELLIQVRAVYNLTNMELLNDIANNSTKWNVRIASIKKMKSIESNEYVLSLDSSIERKQNTKNITANEKAIYFLTKPEYIYKIEGYTRLAFIESFEDISNQLLLGELIFETEFANKHLLACSKITNQNILSIIANYHSDRMVRYCAFVKITDRNIQQEINHSNSHEFDEFLNFSIKSNRWGIELQNVNDIALYNASLMFVTNENVLLKLLQSAPDFFIAKKIIEKISEEIKLGDIIRNKALNIELRKMAIKKVSNFETLKSIIEQCGLDGSIGLTDEIMHKTLQLKPS